MSVTLIGKERLGAVLDGGKRVVASNRTTIESRVVVQALALGIHTRDGKVRFRTAHALGVMPGESVVFEDEYPDEEQIVAVEAFLRITVGSLRRMLDAHMTILDGPTQPLGHVEFGVTELTAPPTADETPLAEAPGFAVFARTDF